MLLTWLTSLALCADPKAPSLQDFSGTWELDVAASDTLERVAEAAGAPAMLVKLAPAKNVQDLHVDGEALVVAGRGAFSAKAQRFLPDGVTATTADLAGTPITLTSRWANGTLESVGALRVDGKDTPVRLARWVRADGRMELRITVGASTARRLFTRLAR